MNRHDAIESIMRRAQDMTDDQIRECIGKALDLAYREGYRQSQEDMNEAVAFTHADSSPIEKTEGGVRLLEENERLRAALARISQGGTSVLISAALDECPINPEVLEQIVKDALSTLTVGGSADTPSSSTCAEYRTNCKMVNLCKTHCVRKSMERDGWELIDGQFVKRDTPSTLTVGKCNPIEKIKGGA